MTEFLSLTAAVIAIGQLLDRIFVGPRQQKEIVEFLQSREGRTPFQYYIGVLSLTREIVFGRFFSGNAISFGFLFSITSMSLLIFLAVVVVQSILIPGALGNIEFSRAQIILLVLFLAFNIFLDFLTVVQTRVFIDATVSANSVPKSILFLVSDIIVTINIFILIFAFALMVIAQFYLVGEKPFLMSLVTIESREERDGSVGDVPDVFLILESDSDMRALRVFGRGSTDLTQEFMVQIIETNASARVSKIKPIYSDFDQFSAAYLEIESDTVTEAISEVLLNNARRELQNGDAKVESYRVVTSPWSSGMSEAHVHYTVAFNLVDRMEDGFPVVPFGEAGWQEMSGILRGLLFASSPRFSSAVYCVENEKFRRVFISNERVQEFDGCEQKVVLEGWQIASLRADLGVFNRLETSIYVPVHAMFITSILPTILFYFGSILLSCSLGLASASVSFVGKGAELYARAPFTIPMLVMFVAISLFGFS